MKTPNSTRCLMAALALSGAALTATQTHAASVNSVINSINGNTVSFNLNFADSDQSIIVDSSGNLKTSGAVAAGDIIMGVINIDGVTGVGGTATFGGINNELTGFYALSVDSISANFAGIKTIHTGALTAAEITSAVGGNAFFLPSFGGFGTADAMVALFEGADNFDGTFADAGDAIDGDFFQSFGGSTAFWDITGTSLRPGATLVDFNIIADDIAAASLATTTTTLANVNFGLDLVDTGTSFLNPIAVNGFDVNPGQGANTLLGGGGGPVNSDLSFSMLATPSPTAAAFGLFGLVAMGVRRRRSAKA